VKAKMLEVDRVRCLKGSFQEPVANESFKELLENLKLYKES
jgi:hypothetical protein